MSFYPSLTLPFKRKGIIITFISMNRTDAILLARNLRANSTPAERYVWGKLRGRRLCGMKFNRQFPIEYKLYDDRNNYFIADFYCNEKKLIIEIDGKYYEDPHVKAYDQERTEILTNRGFKILRFTNEQVINRWEEVEQILEQVLMKK